MKKTLSTLLATLARLFCLLGLTFAAAATHAATLSVSPTNVVAGGTVTATWSGIATPTTTDWLALATPGMANTTYISWRYTTGAASGSVPFSIPSVASGTYELRLFANNGYTRLATSNPFTVGTQTVSGTVTVGGSPLAGVAFAATNGGVCGSSNASGQYSCTVAYGWSGSVTPSSSGHTFTPASRSYSNVVANQTAQDYTAVILYVVSGTVTVGASPLAAVAFAASNGGTCTSSNASGQYSCTVVQGWSGSVTPSAGGYTFTPASRSYSNVFASQSAQDFAAQPVAITAAIFYIHPDHLNTPRLIANQAGTTVWRWDQGEPFGNDVPNNNPSGVGAFEFNLRFPGQYFDRETNLVYNYFRDYDPAIGAYKQSDPIGLKAGLNTYAYVRGNPISSPDPFGLQPTVTGLRPGSYYNPLPPQGGPPTLSTNVNPMNPMASFPNPSPQLPGEYPGINVPWSMPPGIPNDTPWCSWDCPKNPSACSPNDPVNLTGTPSFFAPAPGCVWRCRPGPFLVPGP